MPEANNISRPHARRGATLLEAVVALLVVALVISVMLPALVLMRSQSRLAQCANNVRKVGAAWSEHEMSLGFYPVSGSGPFVDTGDPDLGFGSRQPGGWLFDVLAFTEYAEVRNMGAGLEGAARLHARSQMHSTIIPFINCPERRPPQVFANQLFLGQAVPRTPAVVRSDYRGNSGNVANISNIYLGTGVTYAGSEIRAAQVIDGLGKTMAFGEKYINAEHYYTGSDSGDNRHAYVSMHPNNNGYTATLNSAVYQPRRDRQGVRLAFTFGSAHGVGFHVAYCDASTRLMSYGVDPRVFWALGGRADGPLP